MSCGFVFPPDPNNSLDLDLSNRQTMLSLDILEAQVQGCFFSYVSIVFYYSWMLYKQFGHLFPLALCSFREHPAI